MGDSRKVSRWPPPDLAPSLMTAGDAFSSPTAPASLSSAALVSTPKAAARRATASTPAEAEVWLRTKSKWSVKRPCKRKYQIKLAHNVGSLSANAVKCSGPKTSETCRAAATLAVPCAEKPPSPRVTPQLPVPAMSSASRSRSSSASRFGCNNRRGAMMLAPPSAALLPPGIKTCNITCVVCRQCGHRTTPCFQTADSKPCRLHWTITSSIVKPILHFSHRPEWYKVTRETRLWVHSAISPEARTGKPTCGRPDSSAHSRPWAIRPTFSIAFWHWSALGCEGLPGPEPNVAPLCATLVDPQPTEASPKLDTEACSA
mmetsp:Transcript_104892/g.301864  ORF Transcript_104892/g.301864 Transcript_104892/m.301864 type:complete len:316 (+) Transcript_104892:1690-2637(+)